MKNSVKIMIVEDESIVALELKDRLQKMGYQVTAVADSFEKAMQAFEATPPDLILMDIIIKGDKDGIETAAEINRLRPVPVVFLTAHSDPQTLNRAREQAPYGYVLKPFKERELQITIEMALQRFDMERQVIESKALLYTTLNSIYDGIITTNPQGIINFINPAACQISGWTSEEATGKPLNEIFRIINEFTRESVECPVQKVLETGQSVRLSNNTLLLTRDGREIYIEYSASPIKDETGIFLGVVLVFYDVTKRKQMERQLRESEEKYRSFIEHSNVIAFRIASDLRTVLFHGAVEKILGYKADELANQDLFWEKVIHPDDYKRLQTENQLRQIFANETDQELEFRVIDRHEKIKWVHAFVQKVFDNNGQLQYIQGLVYDISDKKLIEQEFIRSQKLESLGVLAGGIAHDFNNLLTAIFGNIGLAKLYIEDQESKAYKRLAEAEKALVRAKDLTQQLLVFSKGGTPVIQTIDIRDIIQTSANFALRGSNVKFLFEAPDDLWPVDFDEGQLSQIIQNLVMNADQAMPDGGTVAIRCKNIMVKEENPNLTPGRYVRIVVTDQGTGIPPEILDKIFDPYFTTKEYGSGLGLASVYTIVKNHNAHISVDSVVGKGTSFEILIPASQNRTAKPADLQRIETPAKQARVLVMDDQQVVLDFVESTLNEFGFKVETAEEGQEAVNKYQQALESGSPFDLVITDLTVPGGMGGKETLAALLEIDPNVKAIVASGYSGDPVMSEYAKYGFKAVIKKPFHIQELLTTINEVLNSE